MSEVDLVAEARAFEFTKDSSPAEAICTLHILAIRLADEVERLRDDLRVSAFVINKQIEVNQGLRALGDPLDTLRNFFGDMTIKMPIGRAIGEIEQLRKVFYITDYVACHDFGEREDNSHPLDFFHRSLHRVAEVSLPGHSGIEGTPCCFSSTDDFKQPFIFFR